MENLEKLKIDKKIAYEEIRRKHREYWENLSNFETTDDIPFLPQVAPDEWNSFYVPILLRCGAIPKEQLKIGAVYIGSCRNSDEATWDGEKFVYERYKFGFTYKDSVNHFQDDDGYDLFVPIKEKEEENVRDN